MNKFLETSFVKEKLRRHLKIEGNWKNDNKLNICRLGFRILSRDTNMGARLYRPNECDGERDMQEMAAKVELGSPKAKTSSSLHSLHFLSTHIN